MRFYPRIYLILTICTFAAFSALIGCARKEPPKIKLESIPVRIAEVLQEDIRITEQFVGEIRASDEAAVFPRVSGKVKEKIKQESDPVKKDDILMYIDRDEIGFEYMPSPVTAPLDGVIANIYVDKGTSVTPQTAVANIIDIEKVKARINIPEKYFSLVILNQKVKVNVDAYPNEEFEGQISMISPQVDTATRTFPVEVFVSNEHSKLKPGMYARVEMIMKESKQAIIIPREAVLRSDEGPYVFIVEDNIAKKREVSLGIEKLDKVEISLGVNPNDLVVVAGQSRIEDGLKVEVVKEEGR
ncbi:MAG: efflux RND transporter periplasmic adaptor subunit [Candidatus Omnitrophota bacterium]